MSSSSVTQMGNKSFLKVNIYVFIYVRTDQTLQYVIIMKEIIHTASLYLYSASQKTLYLMKIFWLLLFFQMKGTKILQVNVKLK